MDDGIEEIEDEDYVPAYLDNPSAEYMLSDPMWVLDENIVVEQIAKKVAEESLNRSYLSAPMCLAWRPKSKMSFYRIYADGTTEPVYVEHSPYKRRSNENKV